VPKIQGLVASALALGIVLGTAIGFPVRSEAATIPRLGASIRITPTVVPAYGGTVTVHIHVRGASKCLVSAPAQLGTTGWVSCGNRAFATTFPIASNPTASARQVVLRLRVSGPAGHIERVEAVHQVALPTSIDDYSGVSSYGLYGNVGFTSVGDCTIAAVGDILQTWSARKGESSGPLNSAPFISAYDTLVGGTGGPQDGLPVNTVLAYWKTSGIDGNTIAGSSEIIEYWDRFAIEAALEEDGPLYVSFQIPTSDYVYSMDSSSTIWSTNEAPPGTSTTPYGHAAAIVGYDATGPYIATWGYVQHVTWAWWYDWATDAYTVTPGTANWSPNVVTPTTTSIQVQYGDSDPSNPEVELVVAVSGVTGSTSGTVTVYAGNQAVGGCAPLSMTSQGGQLTGTCSIPYSQLQTGTSYYAAFSGDSTYAGSQSGADTFTG
jgi:hypothetical protein